MTQLRAGSVSDRRMGSWQYSADILEGQLRVLPLGPSRIVFHCQAATRPAARCPDCAWPIFDPQVILADQRIEVIPCCLSYILASDFGTVALCVFIHSSTYISRVGSPALQALRQRQPRSIAAQHRSRLWGQQVKTKPWREQSGHWSAHFSSLRSCRVSRP